jgi:hypothetical protein
MKRLVPVLALAAAALWPAAGGASIFKGTVVASQRGTLLVASSSGSLSALRGHARIGSRIALAGGHPIVVGRATRAVIRGIVVRRIGTTLVLSSNHHLIAVPNRIGRRLAAAATTPTTGAVVTTDVSIQNGALEEDDETQVGQVSASSLTVQATIQAVSPGAVTLDVQGHLVPISLPAGLTLPATLVGQTVTINVSLANDDEQGDDDHGGDNGGSGGGGDGGGSGDG